LRRQHLGVGLPQAAARRFHEPAADFLQGPGIVFSKNSRFSSSMTKVRVMSSKIQSSTSPVAASQP